jgi:predicted transcriptional regulator
MNAPTDHAKIHHIDASLQIIEERNHIARANDSAIIHRDFVSQSSNAKSAACASPAR